MSATFAPSEAYAARSSRFLGVVEHAGWRLKHYAIVYGDGPLDAPRFTTAHARAFAELPQPAVTAQRPGVGILIEHQGRGANYLVLAWWDRENELPLRVFVEDAGTWRKAEGSESICVWDLEILWYEREAYVAHMIGARSTGQTGAYLAAIRASD